MTLRLRLTLVLVATVFGAGAVLTALVCAYLALTPVPLHVSLPGPEGVLIDAAMPIPTSIITIVLATMLVALALLTALAGLVGWFVAGYALSPVRRIAAVAREVSDGDVAKRMHYEGPADDVGDLAHAFDTMLDSLAASLDAQRRFAANASHELKTPIATIQTVADVALMQAGDSDAQLVDALRRIREVNARAGQTVERLLAFARAEAAQPGSLTGQPVDLVALCKEVCAQYGVSLRAPGSPVVVNGDEVLLRQAVGNLVGNAVEHGAPGTAEVVVGEGRVGVENQGPALDLEEVERLKEPFVRGAGRVAGSHGLGLSLADAIARAHGGTLDLAPREGGGLRVELSL
ncbi:HAMP domain-containing sensor histidine kinase [Corynebacterium imitans]|uniref:sensor histidine kinase n=1 Tax=Corynebacterium imitans TaxID=156978 RepID=UPI00255188CF|nr:HAMP domain-containing sensor histidine kinase [Corynebacterium imitans]MDK8305921.1 HAMP domain-containing sensor histidine kinase [Corynebacterium imitans]MDK8636974.1 HAMP domain-containing sensor histidine kinase [Corynebacterium imitans]MDK8771948.1 HAMP domain-containing sensor histidine kinase [Corynebacterium imitans]